MHTFHVTGVSTTQTNKDFCGCPFTTGVRNLIKSLVADGERVIHYGNHGSQTAAEDIVVTEENFLEPFGERHKDQYHSSYKHGSHNRFRRDFSLACAYHIRRNIQSGDFVILASDGVHDMIGLLSDIPDIKFVEPTIGYNDPMAEFRIFSTNTWRSFWRGRADRAYEIYHILEKEQRALNYNKNVMVRVNEPRRVVDTAIFPLLDLEDFAFSEEKDDYFLYMGRIVRSKGIMDAIKLTEVLGKRLIVAGPGQFENEFPLEFAQNLPKHVDFIGMAHHAKRKTLLSKAACVLMLTCYNEPFGTLTSEASASGTPVIASDSGCFTETITEGVNGFTGSCLAEWVEASEALDTLSPSEIRSHAEQTFTGNVLYPKYKRFWKRINAYYENKKDVEFTYKKD